jgi:membrane protein required for colicin V production
MNNLPLNVVDLGVFGVILISALLAFSRGLVREVLSIGAWVVAALATIYGLPHLRDITRTYISQQLVADAVTGVTIFVVTLIVCAAISHMVARNVRSSGFGAVDRSLGLLFGVLRGAVLVCLAYLAFVWAEPKPEDQPDVVKNARMLRYVAEGADLLKALLPKDALDRGAAAAADAKAQVEQAVTQQIVPGQTAPGATPDQPKGTAPANDPGYNNGDRKGLDQLFKSNQ